MDYNVIRYDGIRDDVIRDDGIRYDVIGYNIMGYNFLGYNVMGYNMCRDVIYTGVCIYSAYSYYCLEDKMLLCNMLLGVYTFEL